MYIMHIALQGCLRARSVPYGLTADTGGHIKYLLELVEAAEAAGVERQEIVVRRFHDATLGGHYGGRSETMSAGARIVRIDGATPHYLAKEEMAGELTAIVDNLVAHILATGRPDVLHAHYADAGWVAAEVKRKLGIPFVFTGHSLGRVKALAMQDAATGDAADAALKTRIAVEDRVLAEADRIVVSSHDEATRQYPLYPVMRYAERRSVVKLNPPGCELDAFGDLPLRDGLRARIEGPLADPTLPVVLAIARPVAKKNLTGLVKAFAHADLRERANLVVVAGTRDDIRAEEPEHRVVLEELLYLRDRHDLDGSMVMPKRHEQRDVPALYAHARRSGGIFANVALNEPFGLTFLEAAASGLPVVATTHGGPNDIVGRLGNGLLVDPFDTDAIAAALTRLIDDDALRERCAASGLANVHHYGWARHASDYVRDLEALVRPASALHLVSSRSGSSRPNGSRPNGSRPNGSRPNGSRLGPQPADLFRPLAQAIPGETS